MNKKLSIKMLTFSHGSEFACLIDERGVPAYYENLYLIQEYYFKGGSSSSSIAALTSIKLLKKWEEHFDINIKERLKHKKSLHQNEIRSLCSFARRKFKSFSPASQDKVIPVSKRARKRAQNKSGIWAVSFETQIYRLKYIRSYIEWLHTNFNFDDRLQRLEINKLFKAYTPKKKGADEDINDGVDELVCKTVLETISPTSVNNFFGSHFTDTKKDIRNAIQLRNFLSIAILYYSGIRRGELLALRVEDLDFDKNTISIVRRHDDGVDKRKVKPHAKTRGRVIEIGVDLANSIYSYIYNYRANVPEARYHPFLLISHHGSTKGQALSIDSLTSIFKRIREKVNISGIYDFNPHQLRYTWNNRFSKHCDLNRSQISFTNENEMRSYLMGWSPRSKMAELYNRRHIKLKAYEHSRQMQIDLGKVKEGSIDEIK